MKKKMLLMAALVACGSMFAMPVFAEETEVAETEVAEVPEKSEQDLFWLSSIYGQYYGCASEGDDDVELRGETLYIIPNNIAVIETDEPLILPYSYDGTTLTFDLSSIETEDIKGTMSGVFGEMKPLEDEISFAFTDAESPALYITVGSSYTDTSDPLNVKEATSEATTQFCKETYQDDLVMSVLVCFDWKTGDNKLSFGQDGSLSLNDGATTGSYNVSVDSEIEFRWDDGASVYYNITDMTNESMTLVNKDDASNVLVMNIEGFSATFNELVGEAPAGEAVEEDAEALTETEE